MENQEEKKSCCENKEGAVCSHGMGNCCHNWKKCHMMRRIIIIVVIIIAFCLGTQWGEMKGEVRDGNRYEKGAMMNWRYSKLNKAPVNTSGTVTVDVSKTPLAPTSAQ